MANEALSLSISSSDPLSIECCSCGCSTCNGNVSVAATWNRTVKRKVDVIEDMVRDVPSEFNLFGIARVEIENECVALREALSRQQDKIQELYTELEEERNASSSAANEAMSMILRLQREKAEIQMESRQFKRFAEERMAHDQQEFIALEDLLYKKDQTVQSLTFETQAFKHRMLSFGLTEAEIEGERIGFSRTQSTVENFEAQYDFPSYDYPPLKCNLNEMQGTSEVEEDAADVEKYAFGETPHSREHLQNLEYRIYQLEKSPRSDQMDGELYGTKNILDKTVVGQSPRRPRHSRMYSNDSSGSLFGLAREYGQDPDVENLKPGTSFKKMEYFPYVEDSSKLRKVDNASDLGDDMSDRVYTIDSIHNGPPNNTYTGPKATIGICDDYATTPRDSLNRFEMDDPDIKKLYTRLQALEADRESMKQALISMRTDKAQLVLLREIAQHLYKDMTPERRMPVKKPSVIGSFSFVSVFKMNVLEEFQVLVPCGKICFAVNMGKESKRGNRAQGPVVHSYNPTFLPSKDKVDRVIRFLEKESTSKQCVALQLKPLHSVSIQAFDIIAQISYRVDESTPD
ncbi:hypothetical protein IFM89_000343 [Coptis chinensis]|uniref:GTD-binding domain-containing protein n=1 Tax=Coptis chinensis TaxID=261450 RepID=A0A835HAH8_9MAGN|nr:hypothetical protein IFM89_000343 [Coptis chinensis]